MSRARILLTATLWATSSVVILAAGPELARSQPSLESATIAACDPQWEERVARTTRPAVVRIEPSDKPPSSAGSGFVAFDRRHVATAWHVVDDLSPPYDVVFPNGTVIRGTTVAFDKDNDTAIVHLERDAPAPPIELALEEPNPGAPVMALGNPLALEEARSERDPALTGLYFGVTRGVVSAVGKRALRTDVVGIAPGASGGPVVNCRGAVVGILTDVEDPPWNGLVFARRSTMLAPLYGRIGKDTIPSRVSIWFGGTLGAALQFGDLDYVGPVARPAIGLFDGQLRLVGEIGLLWNGDDPSATEALAGVRQRTYWSVGLGATPVLWKRPRWIRPGLTLGLSGMADRWSTQSYRLDPAALGGVRRIDATQAESSYRPFAALDVRIHFAVITYGFHLDTVDAASSVHALTLGVAPIGW